MSCSLDPRKPRGGARIARPRTGSFAADPDRCAGLSRRQFVKLAVAAVGSTVSGRMVAMQGAHSEMIMSVCGPISAARMGVTLPHEHVLVDFIGAAKVSRNRYDSQEVFDVVLPHLKRAVERGVQTLVECTPAYAGRDPVLLRRLSQASGMNILTNTGYYGAMDNMLLPRHAFTETAKQLAARWTREWTDGIEGTGIRPGFIKIAMDAGAPDELHAKLVRAAAQTHLRSGLTIATHTGDGAAAMGQLEILAEEGVAANAWIWFHAQLEQDSELHLRAARQGAWVSFDGVGQPGTIKQYVKLIENMKAHGLLGRTLISQDAGWYHVGEPGGGHYRDYDTIFTELLPALRERGFTDAEIERVMIENPREALTIVVPVHQRT